MYKCIYIPVETKVRELDAKLLLAFEAASKGYKVFIGEKTEIEVILNHFVSGIYIGLAAVKNYKQKYKRIQEKGNKIYVFDEEGLVTFKPIQYFNFKFSDETMEYIDTFFAWGDEQKKMILSCKPEYKEKIIVTGSPRFDLFNEKFNSIIIESSKSIKEKYGEYVLVNTVFGSFNNYCGRDHYINSLKEKKWDSKEDLNFQYRKINFQEKQFIYFTDMIKKLSADFRETNIIVRPHPSENLDVYIKMFKACSNVIVINEGNVHYWIAGAKAVIMNNCTTGVESFANKIPTISYKEIFNEEFDISLPTELSVIAKSYDDIKTILWKIKNQENVYVEIEKKNKLYRRFVQNSDSNMAFKNMINYIEEHESNNNILDISLSSLLLKIKYIMIKNEIKKKIMSLIKKDSLSVPYNKHKFPNFIKSDIEKLESTINSYNENFSFVQKKKISARTYLLYK